MRTASRATARCAGAPSRLHWPASGRAEGLPASNRPSRALTWKDARHRLVDPRHRDLPALGARATGSRRPASRLSGAMYMSMRWPSAPAGSRHWCSPRPGHARSSQRPSKPPEAHALLEHAGEQALVAGHLLALPAREAGHDRADAILDGRTIRRHRECRAVRFH